MRAETASKSSVTPLIAGVGVCQETSEILWEQKRKELNSEGGGRGDTRKVCFAQNSHVSLYLEDGKPISTGSQRSDKKTYRQIAPLSYKDLIDRIADFHTVSHTKPVRKK